MLEASVTKGGSRYSAPPSTGRQSGTQAQETPLYVDRWYVELTTPDGFTVRMGYDPETAYEVASHFKRTGVKARVVSEKVKVRR